MTLVITWIGSSQVNPIDDLKTTPNGYFDTVLDRFGKQYLIKDLEAGKNAITNDGFSKTTSISCDSGIFQLYFETGSGMENTADASNNARRDVVCRVFQDLSNFINTPLKNTNTKVKIWIRNAANTDMPSNALGMATSFYVAPNNAAANFGGIIDGEIYKTIQGGKDSYINTAAPLINSSGIYYHGMVVLNFNNINWNTDLETNAGKGQYDLYSVVLHEVTHALGFNSLLKPDGTSALGSGYQYYSRYDSFLKNNANTQFLLTNTGACSSMYNYNFNSALATSILQPNTSNCVANTTTCSNALKFVGSTTVPIYTPNCFEQGSSYSHFEDMCIASPNTGNDTYFVMSNATKTNSTKRFLKPEERSSLLDIGYSLNTIYGDFDVFGSFKDYGGASVTGLDIEGINDGITSLSAYAFIGNTGSNISISGILANDYNAVSFECVQDVFDNTATISVTSGTINFSSTVPGLHLLRYVPLNTAGKKGNITYIYVYVNQPNSCGVPNACDLVINGDFEQHNGLPTSSSKLNGIVCGWNAIHTQQSSEYYHSASTLNLPNLKVPCNGNGFETDNHNQNAYVGMFIANNGGYPFNESIRTKLNQPLQQNTSYQLSFDISLTEKFSGTANKCQAYLSKDLIIPSGYSYMPITNPNMLFTSSNYNTTTNGWEHVVFNFTTDNIAGEQYLYIGGGLSGIIPDSFITPTSVHNGQCNVDYFGWAAPYYYLDNVSLIPLNGANFDLPATICNTVTIPNLTNYLTATPTNGIFTGNGIINTNGVYSFNATTAGVGTHTITYTYTNSSGCSVSISDSIQVVNTNTVVPTFAQIGPICAGSATQPLPTTSTNFITGSWSQQNLNTNATTTYTFTPNSGQCASSTLTTMTVTVLSATDPNCINQTSCNCLNTIIYTVHPQLDNVFLIKLTNSNSICTSLTIRNTWTIGNGSPFTTNGYTTVGYTATGELPFTVTTEALDANGNVLCARTYTYGGGSSSSKNNTLNLDNKLSNDTDINIYPNPSNGLFAIQINQFKGVANLEVVDLNGRVVYSQKDVDFSTEKSVNLSELQAGIYIVKIKGTVLNLTKKIIIN
ncbi:MULTISPECIES: T9SS type A sorting domain-containing protein [Flavobacterium]|uniref:Secretion system C-terminal sorting domain-containing protein n=1 Tax=Flavobacterium hankyongi TaxID=1176532 RepID=A0ABP8ZRP4_9FLAO|nr:T9SS type A sorting domain-containing protein [Flavobacterium sp. N1846]